MKIDWYSFVLGGAILTTVAGILWEVVRKMYARRLAYLIDATEGMMEANAEEIECRGDEDCDHCNALAALHWSKEMFPKVSHVSQEKGP